MSGYVCPHCGDVVGVFGQGGGEDFCRKEEEKLAKGEEKTGCRFLGRIPIDRELVALLDDVAAKGAQEAGGEDGAAGVDVARPNLVQRYTAIPSFKIVKAVAATVKGLVEEQTAKEVGEGRKLVASTRRQQ
jgi:hypothetical protein